MDPRTEAIGLRAKIALKMHEQNGSAKITKCYAIIRSAEDALHRSFRGENVPTLSAELLAIRNNFGLSACAAIQELALMSVEVGHDYSQDAARSAALAGTART